MINKNISTDQRAFTLARELGFVFLNLKVRPNTSSWIEVNSFDEVFNNFQASYFAGAILIRKKLLKTKLEHFFKQASFSEKIFAELIDSFKTTPETLLHRIVSILPQEFGIDNLFFLRFEAPQGSSNYNLTKELHLNKQHNPQENKSENYCRRWVSINILDELSNLQTKSNNHNTLLIKSQISDYIDAGNQYFIISIAQPTNIIEHTNVSVSIGFEMSKNLTEKIRFINSDSVLTRKVNQTCEKCSIFDCKERVAAPIILQKKRQIKAMIEQIKKLN
jgi:XRE family transcriptional regulator, fatty acid utilization regulator